MKKIIFLALTFILVGCVSEGTRELNEQNYHIGSALVKTDPQMGFDLMQNCGEIVKDIGFPRSPAGQYTPELSAAARKKAADTRDRRSGIVDFFMTTVAGNIPWAGAAIASLLAVWTKVRKNLSDKKLGAVYAGVEQVIDEIKATGDGGKIIAKDAVDTLRTVAGNHNVYVDINRDLQKMRGA